MLFNSVEFALFLPIVFFLYWAILKNTLRGQQGLLLLSSYFFYGWWEVKFLLLIAFSTLIDFWVGQKIEQAQQLKHKKLFLGVSLFVNLGSLAFFKYYNFFLDNFVQAFTLLGTSFEVTRLDIILPVGISFYTFQTLSYSIDIYKGKLKASRDLVSFAGFVSFFPQLVAGPIERASHLLPQFHQPKKFHHSEAVDGIRQILWGLFKKVVIADNCAIYANQIFETYYDLSGSTLLLGSIFFAFQIYGDFSGYSDMAIGLARLLGFRLMCNFSYPYFSRDAAEFWRRWHISLSTWFRDYLYIPLGGSRGGTWMKIRNTFLIFLVSGFWHGANWTFIAWGFINACYFLPLLLSNKNRQHTTIVAENRVLPTLKELLQMLSTFALTCGAWVFFRSNTLSQAIVYLKRIFTPSLFTPPEVFSASTLFFIVLLLLIEWLGRRKTYPLEFTPTSSISWQARWSIYMGLIICILLFGANQQQFIYFQF